MQVRTIVELIDAEPAAQGGYSAEECARLLEDEAVEGWARSVREAIACANRSSNALRPVGDDPEAKRRAEIQAQIAVLENQLAEMEHK